MATSMIKQLDDGKLGIVGGIEHDAADAQQPYHSWLQWRRGTLTIRTHRAFPALEEAESWLHTLHEDWSSTAREPVRLRRTAPLSVASNQ